MSHHTHFYSLHFILCLFGQCSAVYYSCYGLLAIHFSLHLFHCVMSERLFETSNLGHKRKQAYCLYISRGRQPSQFMNTLRTCSLPLTIDCPKLMHFRRLFHFIPFPPCTLQRVAETGAQQFQLRGQ